MNTNTWLKSAIQKLSDISVPTAKLDAELLLADLLQKDRSWLHAHPEHILQRSDLRKLDEHIERRMKHEPISYILGRQEFYGRSFIVSPDTLTPRPETETMIELFLKLVTETELTTETELQIVDVGTGSGCIIISVALVLSSILNPQSSISYTGLDISKPALKIAKHNAKNLNAEVAFKHFDLTKDSLASITKYQLPNIFLANLPYVPEDFHINLAASHEPAFAIFGGKDGLDYYRVMFNKLSNNTKYVLTESLPPQHEDLANIAKKSGFKLQKTQDLIQLFKYIKKS